MGFFDYIVSLILIIILVIAGALYFYNIPRDSVDIGSYESKIDSTVPLRSAQFYSNMRFEDRKISYGIDPICSIYKIEDIERALGIIQDRTVLSFYKVTSNPQIIFLCSEIAPEPEQKNHFVAGEGGPVVIINTTRYSVIKSSKVSLYRPERCDEPKIALHEILHALGFDHNSDKGSILYPVTDCAQVLDNYILEDINKIYEEDSLPDLLIERVNANATGRYLNFEISIANYGLKISEESNLNVYVNGKFIEKFYLGKIDLGSRKVLNVENLKASSSFDSVKFEIVQDGEELDLSNNFAELKISP